MMFRNREMFRRDDLAWLAHGLVLQLSASILTGDHSVGNTEHLPRAMPTGTLDEVENTSVGCCGCNPKKYRKIPTH
jgi:hypothetical protein